ncbi:MAG: HAD family hydrolase [Clostridia bacterium]|nr:HAD family hydrolase [Clostridia bacterium]
MAYAVIFDLDGTLADTMNDLKTGMNGMLTKLGYKNRTKAELLRFINNGSREFVRRSLPKGVQGEDFIIDSALEVYNQEYAKCYCEKTEAFNGIVEMLEELSKEGFKIGVLSNKQDRFVKDIIAKLFNIKLFGCVMGHSTLPPKPNPASALAVAKKLGVKPSKCIFVGDSDVDMKTAINSGMKSIGVSWGYRNVTELKEAGAMYIAGEAGDIVKISKSIRDGDVK